MKLRKKTVLTIGIPLGIIILLLLLLHSSFIETRVLRIIQNNLLKSGIILSVDSFNYNLFNLKVRFKNIEMRSSADKNLAAFFSGEKIEVQVPLKIILGKKIDIKSLEVINPSLNVQIDESGVSNLPTGGSKPESASKYFQMPDLKINKAVLTGACLRYQDKNKAIFTEINGLGAKIEWTGEKTHKLVLNKTGPGTIGLRNFNQKLEDIQLSMLIKENGVDIEELKFTVAENEINFSGYLHDFISPNISGDANGRINWKDIAAFATVPENPSGFLNFDFKFQGNKEKGYHATASLKNDSTYLRGLERTEINLESSWKDDLLTVKSLDVSIGDGQLEGKGKLFTTESPDSNDFDLSWDGIDLKIFQPWLTQPIPLDALFSGKINLNWKKLTLEGLKMQADFKFKAPQDQFNSKQIPLSAVIIVAHDTGKTNVSVPRLNIAQTDMKVDFLLTKNSVSGKYWIESKDLAETLSLLKPIIPEETKKSLMQMSPAGYIQLAGEISGEPADPTVEIAITGKEISVERLSGLKINGEVSVDKRKAEINSLKIYDNNMSLELSGELPFDINNSAVNISTNMKNIPVERVIEEMNIDVDAKAVLDISANVKGTLVDPIIGLSLSSDGFSCFNHEFGKIDLDARYQNNNISIESFTVRKNDAQIRMNGFYDIKKQSYYLDLIVDSFNLDKLVIPGSISSLNGSVNLSLHARGSFSLPELTAKISAHDLEYAGVNIGDIRLHGQLNNKGFHTVFVFSDYNTLVRAWAPSEMIFPPQNGQIEKTGNPAEVYVEIGNLKLLQVLSLLPDLNQQNVKGMISSKIYLASRVRSLEGLSGSAEFKIESLEINDIPVYQKDPFVINIKDGKMELINFSFEGKEGILHAEGEIDFTRDNSIDLKVNSDIDLGFIEDRLEEGQIAGKISLSTHITNTIKDPDIRGEVHLKNINFLLPYPGVYLSNINGDVQVDPERVLIQNISGDLNGGNINIKGGMTLDGMNWTEAEVNLMLNDVWIEMPVGLSSRINSNMIFISKQEKSTLTGEMWLSDTMFTENFSVRSTLYKYLQRSPLRRMQSQGNPFLENLNMNMTIRTDTNIKIENNIAHSELKADLVLNGSVNHPSLAGRALIEQGELYFTGNTFIIEEGIIDFINPSQIEPYLNIKARTRVNEYSILLTVTGPASKLSASLSSDPALKQVDIISLLVTGNTLDSASASALNIAGNEVLTYLNNALSGRIENVVKNILGLDSVKIDAALITSQENPNSRLTLGKNLTRELQLIYSQDIKDARNQTWILDYYPDRKINVQGIKRDNNAYSLGVKHNIPFGGKSGVEPAFNRDLTAGKSKVGNIFILGDNRFIPKVRSLLDIRTGKWFDFYNFHKNLKKIKEYFVKADYLNVSLQSSREVKPDGKVDLTVKFDPGSQISFQFRGVSFSNNIIKEIKKIWSEAGTEQFAIREIQKYLRRYYIQKKFYQSEIQVKEVSTSQTKKVYAVIVDTGLKYNSIITQYSGNLHFSSRGLDKIIKRQEYIQEILLYPAKFKKKLEQHFYSLGFLDAKIRDVRVEYEPDERKMLLFLSMNEGKRYRLGQIITSGNSIFSGDNIKQFLSFKEGDVFFFDNISHQVMRIKEEYSKKGFNQVRILSEIKPNVDSGQVDLLLDISENQRSIISDIKILGFRRTKETSIKRELTFYVGDTVDYRKINESRKNLYDLGIFEYVDIEIVPEENSSKEEQIHPDSIPEKPFRVLVNVYESHPYQLKYGLEYNTETSLGISGELRDINWRGSGHLLGTSFRYNRDEKDLRLFYRSFYFLKKKINTELFSFANRMKRPGFTVDRYGFTFQQQIRLGGTYLLTYNYTHEGNRIFDKEPFLVLFGDQNINFETFSLGLIRDTRNNVLNPMSGTFLSHNLEYAPGILGDDIKYLRYFGQTFCYIPVTDSLLYAVGVRLGLSRASGYEMPLSKRFFAGGSTTVRGFEKNGLGEQDDATGLALGGEAVFIWNQEIRFPLIKKIRGAVFLDIGNVYSTLSEFNLNNLREGAGFGLRYQSPYFLIRFDWGFNLDLRPGEKRSQIYFSIGQSF